ncbi:MAG: shikimate dehydrogenase [Acidobacteriota bacterium]|nr:shikimate dehydrogenase [Acidobacteriota bacterium]
MASLTYTPRLLPARLPRISVAITGADPVEMIEKAEAVVRENPFLEFRLDYLRKPASALARIKRFADYYPHALVIATCRRAANGGKFRGTVAAQLDILIKAANNGCQLVDIELQTANQMRPQDFTRVRNSAALILSFHDFRATRDLDKTFEKMRRHPADFYKVITTAKSLSDNVVMMKFLERQSERYSMIGVCMGEQGIISRVLGVRAGSVFTFGAASAGEETAPGQIAHRTLRETYRIDQVDAATRVYGVVGDPVAHSLSPAMMNVAFRRENVNGVYLALHAKTLKDLLACVRDIPIHGLSVTMPYKEELMKHLDNTDPLTAKIGACNTVVRSQEGKLYGFNTDIAGVVRPLEQRFHLQGSKVLVVGAGGAARAAVWGLKERGSEVYIINRTASSGKKLAKQARAKYVGKKELKKLVFDCIVNATPVGMGGAKGGAKSASKASPLSEKEINAKYVFEMVYNPAETRFTQLARKRGAIVIPGIEMFVQQGARQFEIWSGKPAPVADMQHTVLMALEQRAAEATAGVRKNGGKSKKKRR